MHGKVLRADDPFWKLGPPWGFQCRCRKVSLSQRDVDRLKLSVVSGSTITGLPDPGWSSNAIFTGSTVPEQPKRPEVARPEAQPEPRPQRPAKPPRSAPIEKPVEPVTVRPAEPPIPGSPVPAPPIERVEDFDAHLAELRKAGRVVRHQRARRGVMDLVFPDGAPSIPALERTWGSEAGGFKIVLGEVLESHDIEGGEVRFTGEIRSQGGMIGEIIRTFKRHRDGRLEVHHDYFKLTDTSAQGKGLGEAMLRQSIQAYEQLGVDEITVDTAWVGQYTWASFGYNWDAEEAARRALMLGSFLRRHGVPRDRAETIAERASRRAWDVAALDVDGIRVDVQVEGHARREKAGKAFLLSQGGWGGTLRLDPDHETYKRAKERLGL